MTVEEGVYDYLIGRRDRIRFEKAWPEYPSSEFAMYGSLHIQEFGWLSFE